MSRFAHPSVMMVLLAYCLGAHASAQEYQAGFPIELSTPGVPPDWLGDVTVADLDGDGTLEIVVYGYPSLYVVEHDGTPREGWPVATPIAGALQHKVLAGNIVGDERAEIIIVTLAGHVFAIDADGNYLSGFPWSDMGTIGSSSEDRYVMALADLDGDGLSEIVLVPEVDHYEEDSPVLHVLNGDGSEREGFPFIHGYSECQGLYCEFSLIAVSDLDFDGRDEIVVAVFDYNGMGTYYPGPVYVVEDGGVVREGWPALPPPAPAPYAQQWPVGGVVDFDGDLSVELFGLQGEYIGILTADGEPFMPWVLPITYHDWTPAIGDVDGDGEPEVLLGSYWDILVFDREPWPTTLVIFPESQVGGLAIADLDGDGSMEVVARVLGGGNEGESQLHILDSSSGESWPGWPVTVDSSPPFGGSWRRNNAIADLDGDGDLEIILAAESQLHVFDIAHMGPYAPRVEWAGVGNGPRYTFNYHTGKNWRLLRGDANGDGAVDITDAVRSLQYVFLSGPVGCEAGLDTDGSGEVDVADVVALFTYFFLLGPPPPHPYPECGRAPKVEGLTCETACYHTP